MTNQDSRPKNASDLRQKAEALARERAASSSEDGAAFSPEEIRQTLHELRVHQIELEMQNEELRRAHVEAEAAKDRYFDLYDLAPVGYCTLSEKGIILDANLTAATLLGMARGALIRQPLTRFIRKEDHDIYYRHRKALFETGDPQVCDLQMARPDGALFWGLMKVTLVQDPDGAPACRCVITDISQRKRAEAEKERLQAELMHAQKMESVGRLAGGVAHDFNNMLGIVLGYGENLLEQIQEGDPLRESVKEIIAAGKRSAALTRQLLAFARKQVISPRVLDLNDTVEEMLKLLRRLIGEDIHLVWSPGHDLWTVNMDPAQIDQILANLCVNARDAISGVGNVTIQTRNVAVDEAHCSAHAGAAPGDYVLLAVADDGCGMDRETMDHLFEPFFTTKEVGKGSGMGLPTVYGIVKQNNGFIEVESEPGKGTAVFMYLPSVRGDADEEGEADAGEMPGGQGETVLLVEDEAGLLNMARIMLERFGYRVLAANTPEEAISLAGREGEEIHLLMTDVVMPRMNGQELADRLRETRPDLKCLFMSGYTSDIIAGRGRLDKGVHFIQKPFSLGDLAVKVRKAIDR